MKRTQLEADLHWQIKAAGLPAPHVEFCAIPGRRFRWDMAWPEHRILLEVQGGIWGKGAHSSGAGINRDTEKQNLACIHGWRTLAVTVNQIKDGSALRWVTAVFREVA